MICIACNQDHPKLANCHVISNFVRKRLAGLLREDGSKKYSFNWVGRPTLPRQDLPKPELMCRECDSELGAKVENDIAALIMPDDVNVFAEWQKLPIIGIPIEGVFEGGFSLGIYDYPLALQWRIEKFALLTAWRALHAMQQEGESLSTKFLSSPRGQHINKSVINHLFRGHRLDDVKPASFYYWSPYSVSTITGKDDEMPFAWAELGVAEEFLGVAVMFGYWVVVWPVFESEPHQARDKLALLNHTCFIDWALHVKTLLG